MPSIFTAYDSAGNARVVKTFTVYDSAGNARVVKEASAYDSAGNKRVYYSANNPGAANFMLNNAASLSDTLEGSSYGMGWGQFNTSNDNTGASTTPVNPPSVGGIGSARCLFTSNGNSGDVGLPQNLIIYGVTNQVVPNTDESFAQMFVAGIGTFLRANATYYANGFGSQGSEWHWAYAGPYFNPGASHQVNFT